MSPGASHEPAVLPVRSYARNGVANLQHADCSTAVQMRLCATGFKRFASPFCTATGQKMTGETRRYNHDSPVIILRLSAIREWPKLIEYVGKGMFTLI
jgi:hypothetical protein